MESNKDKDQDEESLNNSPPSIEKAFKFRKINSRVRGNSTRKKPFKKNMFTRKHTHNQGRGQDMPQDHHQNHQQLQKKHQ